MVRVGIKCPSFHFEKLLRTKYGQAACNDADLHLLHGLRNHLAIGMYGKGRLGLERETGKGAYIHLGSVDVRSS